MFTYYTIILGGGWGVQSHDDVDDAGGGVQNWPKVDGVICARSLSLGLIIWQTQVCLQRYLSFHLNTEVTFEKSSENTFPAFTVCPAYHVAYNISQLKKFGITSREQYKALEWGNRLNSTFNEHETFKKVTHDIQDIIKSIEIRFTNSNQFDKQNISTLNYKEKYHRTYGRCFEIDIQEYGGEKLSLRVTTTMDVYIFIKEPGVFFDNENSRLEGRLGQCLFIELIYELYKKRMNGGCAKQDHSSKCLNYGDLTYDDCKEQAVEIQMVEELNCVVPFIESNHSVCKTKNIQKQAVLLSGTKLRFSWVKTRFSKGGFNHLPTLKQYLLQNSISLIKLVYRIAILRYWAILVHFLSFIIFF